MIFILKQGPDECHPAEKGTQKSYYRLDISWIRRATITIIRIRSYLNSRTTPHTSPLRVSYGVSGVSLYKEKWPRYIESALYSVEYWGISANYVVRGEGFNYLSHLGRKCKFILSFLISRLDGKVVNIITKRPSTKYSIGNFILLDMYPDIEICFLILRKI